MQKMVQNIHEDAESVFDSEIREKKSKVAQYKSATKGRRLGKGNVYFASDLMTPKERRQYQKAGEVQIMNMYDTILPVADFNELELHEKKNRMQYWRSENKIKDIQQGMGISNKAFYDLIEELGLPVAKRGGSRKGAGKKTDSKPKELKEQKSIAISNEVQEQNVQQIIVDGLHLVFNGTYKAEQIQKQLKKFSVLLEDEPDDFFVEIRLMQKQPKK